MHNSFSSWVKRESDVIWEVICTSFSSGCAGTGMNEPLGSSILYTVSLFILIISHLIGFITDISSQISSITTKLLMNHCSSFNLLDSIRS